MEKSKSRMGVWFAGIAERIYAGKSRHIGDGRMMATGVRYDVTEEAIYAVAKWAGVRGDEKLENRIISLLKEEVEM